MNGSKTSSVPHRKIHFDTIRELRAELDRIEQATSLGELSQTGNWSAGQVLSHLAAWIEYAYVGFPLKPLPFFLRWLLRLQLKKMLQKGMPRGMKIPGVQGGTTGADIAEIGPALHRYRAALQRLESSEEAKFESPAFGKLSHEDRIRLNLRHAELHLGYLKTENT